MNLPVLFNNASDFLSQLNEITHIPEANLALALCRLPANLFTSQNLVNLVAKRWRKQGSEYQWSVTL